VGIHRQLAETSPTGHLPDLAMALGAFAHVRAAGGVELTEGLAAAEEAVAIFARLGRQQPRGNDARFALATLALILDRLGRTGEAATIRRQLA